MGGRRMKEIFDYYKVKNASPVEIEKTIHMLPKIKKSLSWYSNLGLQLFITPKYYFVSLITITLFFLHKLYTDVASNDMTKSVCYLYICFYITCIIALTIPEIYRGHEYKMEEMERTCRYHYVQILFVRMVLFISLIFMAISVFALGFATIYSLSFIQSLIMLLLPFIIILQATLLTMKIMKYYKSYIIIISFVGIAAIVLLLVVPFIIEFALPILIVSELLLLGNCYRMTRNILEEVKHNETFSEQFN